jgi:hypothetical protein
MMSRNEWERFTPEEAERIRQMIVTAGAEIVCPRCGQPLGMDMLGGGGTIAIAWEAHCDICQRHMIVRDLPERPFRPGPANSEATP